MAMCVRKNDGQRLRDANTRGSRAVPSFRQRTCTISGSSSNAVDTCRIIGSARANASVRGRSVVALVAMACAEDAWSRNVEKNEDTREGGFQSE